MFHEDSRMIYPVVNSHSYVAQKVIEIADLPIDLMVIFNSYVKLPEGMYKYIF